MINPLVRLRIVCLLGGLLLAAACSASDSGAPAPYTEGQEYVTLPAPQQRYSDEGKVEVVEVFSYGCIHCDHFAPLADQMRKALPAGVVFKLVPAAFNEQWVPYARAFYAAKKLGVMEQNHLALFKAKFDQHYPLNSLDDLADFYAARGVDRGRFMQIATSPEVTAQLRSDMALLQKWQVDGTPTIVVDGKYRSNNVHTLPELAALTQWLAKRELSGK